MSVAMGWVYWVAYQLLSLVLTVVGWVLLAPFALLIATRRWPTARMQRPKKLRRFVAAFQSFDDASKLKSGAFSPFADGERNALEFYAAIRTFVSVLLFVGSPPTVIWSIVFCAADPIKRHIRRTRTHISKKYSEILPTSANGNAFGSVPTERRVIWIDTPIPHASPRCVFPAVAQAVRAAILAAYRIPVGDYHWQLI